MIVMLTLIVLATIVTGVTFARSILGLEFRLAWRPRPFAADAHSWIPSPAAMRPLESTQWTRKAPETPDDDGGPEGPPAAASAAAYDRSARLWIDQCPPVDPGWRLSLLGPTRRNVVAVDDGERLLWRMRDGLRTIEAHARLYPLLALEVYIDGVLSWTERFKDGMESLLVETALRERQALRAQGCIEERKYLDGPDWHAAT